MPKGRGEEVEGASHIEVDIIRKEVDSVLHRTLIHAGLLPHLGQESVIPSCVHPCDDMSRKIFSDLRHADRLWIQDSVLVTSHVTDDEGELEKAMAVYFVCFVSFFA